MSQELNYSLIRLEDNYHTGFFDALWHSNHLKVPVCNALVVPASNVSRLPALPVWNLCFKVGSDDIYRFIALFNTFASTEFPTLNDPSAKRLYVGLTKFMSGSLTVGYDLNYYSFSNSNTGHRNPSNGSTEVTYSTPADFHKASGFLDSILLQYCLLLRNSSL